MKEIWSTIKGYEELYEISNLGNIKSLERWHQNNPKGGYFQKERIIKSFYNPTCNIWSVQLKKDKQHKTISIHRLMAMAFIPNPLNKEEVNHINGDRSDNRLENLEWVTREENMQHAYRIGLKKGLQGINNPKAKLNNQQVRLIKHLKNCRPKIYGTEVCKIFGVTNQLIYMIWNNQEWKHILLEQFDKGDHDLLL